MKRIFDHFCNVLYKIGLVSDYVVESGSYTSYGAWASNPTWYYRKWNSGLREQWTINYNIGKPKINGSYTGPNSSTTVNRWYTQNDSTPIFFGPRMDDVFTAIPHVEVCTNCKTGLLRASVKDETTSHFVFYISDTISDGAHDTVYLNIYVMGRWK